MHKMGWKWMTFAFFSIRIGAFQMNRLARLAYVGSDEHQKILWRCMHEAGVGWKNFTSGIAELFDEA